MNWVGGARRRICGADIKSIKGQRKLQKEYFERRRLGIVNLNAIGKTAKRNNPSKDAKHQISQDILDFQNHKQLNDGVLSSNKARAVFRVVNLNRKLATGSVPKPSNARYETVEMPLSPVEKHSILQLSYSPTSQDEQTDSSLSTDRQPSLVWMTSNKPDVNNSFVKQQRHQLSNLQLFNDNEVENLPHLSLAARASSSTIDLFGMTMKKPKKADKSNVMPPPSYGVNSAKVKRKRSSVQNTRIHEMMETKLSGDSDYPSDDSTISQRSLTRDRILQIPEQYELTPMYKYCPKTRTDDEMLNDFQIVPSQKNSLVKNRFNHMVYDEGNDVHGSEFRAVSNSFKLFSPLRSSDFISETETDLAVSVDDSSGDNYFNVSEIFENHETNFVIPCVKESYSSDSKVSLKISERGNFSQSRGQHFLMEHNTNLHDRSLLVHPDDYLESDVFNTLVSYQTGRDEYFNERNNNFAVHTNPSFLSSEAFHLGQITKSDNIKCCKSFKFTEESSFSNAFNTYSSYNSEKCQNSETERNMLIQQRLTTELYSASKSPCAANKFPEFLTFEEQSSISQTDISADFSMKKANSSFHTKDTHRFVADTNLQLFEPLYTSTPHNPPICLNKHALDVDVDKQIFKHANSIAINENKSYPVNDLLNEMIDLESQSEKLAPKTFTQPSKVIVCNQQCEMSEMTVVVVGEILSDLVSKVETDIDQDNKTPFRLRSQHRLQERRNIDQKMQSSKDNAFRRKAVAELLTESHESKNHLPLNMSQKNIANGHEKETLANDPEVHHASIPRKKKETYKRSNSQICHQNNIQNFLQTSQHSGEIDKNHKPNIKGLDETTMCKNVFNCLSDDSITINKNLPQNFVEKNSVSAINRVANERKSCNNLYDYGRVTISTQTILKSFTDTASSPITFPIENLENDPCVGKKTSTIKAYSLRPRPRFCHDDLSKQEE